MIATRVESWSSIVNAATQLGRTAAVRLLDGQFDVLRIVIQTADDDQVLEPAGDEQLAVVEEAQIAGAEKWPLVAAVVQMAAENLLRLFRTIPITLRDAGPLDPDLADLAFRDRESAFPASTITIC